LFSNQGYPFRTTITESGTIRVTGLRGPTVGTNETMAITTSPTYTSISRTPSSTPFKQIVRREALSKNITQSEIKKAEALVKAAITQPYLYLHIENALIYTVQTNRPSGSTF
jgi:hypothetical protein